MNCDRVFAVLTRGPFPSGAADDHLVESHLACCPDCRQFADALRPDGSGSDAESLIAEESRGLPSYWGVAALPGGSGLVSTKLSSRKLSTRRRTRSMFKRTEPLAHLSGWQLAFAVLMGAMLGTVLRLLGYAEQKPNPPVAYAAPVVQVAADLPRTVAPQIYQQLVEKLGAMPECIEQRYPSSISASGEYEHSSLQAPLLKDVRCCTECHNSTSPRLSLASSTARISRSCQVCHNDLPATISYRP